MVSLSHGAGPTACRRPCRRQYPRRTGVQSGVQRSRFPRRNSPPGGCRGWCCRRSPRTSRRPSSLRPGPHRRPLDTHAVSVSHLQVVFSWLADHFVAHYLSLPVFFPHDPATRRWRPRQAVDRLSGRGHLNNIHVPPDRVIFERCLTARDALAGVRGEETAARPPGAMRPLLHLVAASRPRIPPGAAVSRLSDWMKAPGFAKSRQCLLD